MKKTKKILSLLLLVIILFSNFSTIFAKSIAQSDKIHLVFGHDCVSVLKVKGKDELKQVSYVYYEDPDTGMRYPAFCVEPGDEGIGTGAGNSYDVTVSQLNNPILWRMLYYGYVGSTYQHWGLACDDDLYFATKTAIHCFADGTTPETKYEIPNRVGRGDNVTLAEVQARGAKVLQVAQKIYDDAYANTNDNYIKATVSITKGSQTETTLNGTKYLLQNYSVTANKELSSYDVNIASFPEGTRILNSSNNDSTTMSDSTLKIAIPINSLTENFTGYISVYNAKVKSFPIFYGTAPKYDWQDYIFSDPSEVTSARTTLNIDTYKSTLKIVKKDDEQKPVANAVFNLKYENGQNIGDFTTDTNGNITVSKLRQGNVIVTEVKVPDKYILDSSSKSVYLAYNSTSNLEITNELKRGNLKVIKVDKDNNEIKISNVKFQLLDANKKVVGTYTTDSKGEISIEGLKIGTYTLKETEENSNYYPLAKDTTVTIEYNQTTTCKIENEKLKGRIRIIKVDEDFNEIKLKDVEFQIINSNGVVVETIKTSSNGEATTSRLPIGEYTIKEIKTGDSYILNEQNKHITIKKDTTTDITITNLHKKGNVKVFKVDKDNHKVALGNVEFDLYSEEFGKVIGTYFTDENGEIYIEHLRMGNYKLIEKKTNKWYNLAENTDIQVQWDTTINEVIENELKKGQIKVIKVDEDNHKIKLKDVVFEVLDENKNILETITTNENGEATTSRYSVRDYDKLYLREIKTDKNYVLSNKLIEVVLEANQIKDIMVTNKVKTGKIRVIKVDKDNNKILIPNVTFEIIDNTTNKVVDTITTNALGVATTKELKITSTYSIKEINTDKKYKLNTDNIITEVEYNNIKNITITNEKKKGQVRIIKVDKDNNEVKLEGVTFEILDSKMNVIEEITTDKNGEAISSKLPCIDETYYIREKETLDTYVLNEETKTIVLEEDQIKDIQFENEKIKGYLEITKVDAKNHDIKLKDAVFEIYNDKDELVGTLKTDENGKATSELLVKGKYYLKEVETGSVYYLLNEETFEFEIVNNHEIVPVVIENEPVDIEVTVDKEGDIETKPNEIVNYTFSNIANASNTYLDSFKWFDYIPTDCTRIENMTTGTWNQDLIYNIYYKTNKSEEYTLYQEDLSTKENYDLDFTTLEFAEDEYITEICFDFGKVDIGFREDISPTLQCRALGTLEDSSTFTNYTRTVGNYYGIETEAHSKWTTIVHIPEEPEPVLPRTGR